MDVIWYHFNQIKGPIGNNFSFNILFCVASVVFLISHLNVGIERIFVHGKQNQKSIVRPKSFGSGQNASLYPHCQARSPWSNFKVLRIQTKELLHNAKKVTMEYNQKHSSKQDWNLIPYLFFLSFVIFGCHCFLDVA